MKPFLKEVVEYIVQHYGDKLTGVCMVFPNSRPALYFRKYFAEGLTKPAWSPNVCSVSELFSSKSGLREADELASIMSLWTEYKKQVPAAGGFDDFYSWGRIMLSDFDDIDTYLADASQVFTNVSDLKEIDSKFDTDDQVDIELIRKYWGNILSSKSSDEKESFLQLWQVLADLYFAHRSHLKKKDLGSKGMILREVAEHCERFDDDTLYCFAGFNILSSCEKKLMHHLRKCGKALFFWDYDSFYIDNKNHEAGYFMRDNLRDFPMPEDFKSQIQSMAGSRLKIHCVAAPSDIAQVKYAGSHLAEILAAGGENGETALILGNEDLLPLVLHSMPECIGPFNISMGLNARHTDAVAWLRIIIIMQQKARVSQGVLFYHKYVIALLNHPITALLNPECVHLGRELLKQNRVYIPAEEFSKYEALNRLFRFAGNDALSLSNYLADTISLLLDLNSQNDSGYQWQLNSEVLYSVYKNIIRLRNTIEAESVQFEAFRAFLHLIDQILKTTVVPFDGEPLVGMQVLGLLETRLLDFKNLIILSLNEGVLPKKSVSPSFIPMNLRYAYHLPTYEHSDSLFAYYFYRLLHRAENVTLVYKMATRDVGGGEKSRFIYQLQYELPAKVDFSTLGYGIGVKPTQVISIEKDAATHDFLNKLIAGKLATKKLSASNLNMYLKCPLSFYFAVVAGLREPDSIDEDGDARRIGTILHETMKGLYQVFLNNKTTLTADIIGKLMNDDRRISEELLKQCNIINRTDFNEPSQFSGKHRVFYEILKSYVTQILAYDAQYTPFSLAGLEYELNYSGEILTDGNKLPVAIKAIVDRIDVRSGLVRVLDYKTGKVKRDANALADIFSVGRSKDLDYVFQLLLYCTMIKKTGMFTGSVQPAILSVQELYSDAETLLKIEKQAIHSLSDETGDAFNEMLNDLIAEIANPKIAFFQAPEQKKCEWCLFRNICNIY